MRRYGHAQALVPAIRSRRDIAVGPSNPSDDGGRRRFAGPIRLPAAVTRSENVRADSPEANFHSDELLENLQ